MPELPEVETVVRALHSAVAGARIQRVVYASRRVARNNLSSAWRRAVEGVTLNGFSRRGKYILFELSDGAHLVGHLRLTGRFRLLAPGDVPKHTRLILALVGGPLPSRHHLCLIDTRQFAHVEWLRAGQLHRHSGLARLGPDALNMEPVSFTQIFADTRRPLKSLLLDQTRIAGLGNIYVDEALFASRLHPLTPSHSLRKPDILRLQRAINRILIKAITMCGTSFDTFSDLSGEAGGFAPRLKVYQRTGLPCRRCRTPIERIVIVGRGTHLCPRCQPNPGSGAPKPSEPTNIIDPQISP